MIIMESETISIDKNILKELQDSVEDIQLKLESLELASDPELMKSLAKSKEQIEKRDFADWDELQNTADEAV
jgi:PHD/YefM family antitoxin component YafN of YafNO toxin-antitoxin module